LDSGVTRLAIVLVSVGFMLFVNWIGVLYESGINEATKKLARGARI
jgi:hypothetical protein